MVEKCRKYFIMNKMQSSPLWFRDFSSIQQKATLIAICLCSIKYKLFAFKLTLNALINFDNSRKCADNFKHSFTRYWKPERYSRKGQVMNRIWVQLSATNLSCENR